MNFYHSNYCHVTSICPSQFIPMKGKQLNEYLVNPKKMKTITIPPIEQSLSSLGEKSRYASTIQIVVSFCSRVSIKSTSLFRKHYKVLTRNLQPYRLLIHREQAQHPLFGQFLRVQISVQNVRRMFFRYLQPPLCRMFSYRRSFNIISGMETDFGCLLWAVSLNLVRPYLSY